MDYNDYKKKIEIKNFENQLNNDILKYMKEQYRLELLENEQKEKDRLDKIKKEEEEKKNKDEEKDENDEKFQLIKDMNKGKIDEIGPGYYNPIPVLENNPQYTIAKSDREEKEYYIYIISAKIDIPGPNYYNVKPNSPKPTNIIYRPFGCLECNGVGCEKCKESITIFILL